jgi:hypothetical protein
MGILGSDQQGDKVYQRAFNHVKTPITRVLAYPDYSKVFESYKDTYFSFRQVSTNNYFASSCTMVYTTST